MKRFAFQYHSQGFHLSNWLMETTVLFRSKIYKFVVTFAHQLNEKIVEILA